jgi:hypothetical protein
MAVLTLLDMYLKILEEQRQRRLLQQPDLRSLAAGADVEKRADELFEERKASGLV